MVSNRTPTSFMPYGSPDPVPERPWERWNLSVALPIPCCAVISFVVFIANSRQSFCCHCSLSPAHLCRAVAVLCHRRSVFWQAPHRSCYKDGETSKLAHLAWTRMTLSTSTHDADANRGLATVPWVSRSTQETERFCTTSQGRERGGVSAPPEDERAAFYDEVDCAMQARSGHDHPELVHRLPVK
jgi:hypothetical protein